MIELFGLPIYIGVDSTDLTSIEKDILTMSNDPSDHISNDGGWQSQDKHLHLVDHIINLHVKKYFRQLGNDSVNYTITSQWANVNTPGSANIMHNHGDADFSGIVYIKVPKNSGNLFLHNPYAPVRNLTAVFPFAKNSSTGHYVEVETGLVVLFPGNVFHQVLVNRSEENRISVAFNLDIDK